MQMQKTEIAVAAGWEEDTSDVAIDNVAIENTPIQDTPQSPPHDALNPNTLVSNISLLDTEDRVAPNQINSEKPVWRNPIPRTILVMVGAGTLGFFLVRLTEGNGLINPTQNQVVTNANSMSKPQVTGDEKGELQAKLANVGLKQQIDTLKMKKAEKASRSTANPSTTPEPQPVRPVTSPPPRALSAYNSPPTVVAQSIPRPAVTQSFPSPLAKSISVKPAPIIVPPVQPTPQRSVQTTVPKDPMEQWLAAANVGSYGGMSPVSGSQTASDQSDDSYQTADYQTGSVTTDNSDWQLSGGLGRPPIQDNSKVEATDQQSDYQEVNYSTAATNVVVGTRASGKLETPIAWSGQLENPSQNFLIQLTEPIKAADKSIAVPKGAYLVAQVSGATETGLIQMSVVSVVNTENGQTSERPIPEGALLILGKGGKPLKATAQGRSSSSDLGMAVLSGLSNATGLINQPTSQSAFSSGGSFQTTTTSRNPNYLAGFGQGAAQVIVGQMQARNQQARQSIQSEPKVFVLNQGTSVQVFVNQSVSL